MFVLPAIGAALVCAGHCALWVTVFNRMNAWHHRWLRVVEKIVFCGLAAPMLWMVWHVIDGSFVMMLHRPPAWAMSYSLACGIALAWKVPHWLCQRLRARRLPAAVLAAEHRRIDIARQLGVSLMSGAGRLWGMFPGNESAQLAIERKTLRMPRTSDRWDDRASNAGDSCEARWADRASNAGDSCEARWAGLTITHLSDLHFTGRVTRDYFERVVDEANQFQSDMIFLTGDIVDKRECLAWVGPLLGRLRATCGVFFVLGNHDQRPGGERVRAALVDAGLISLGGRSVVVNCNGAPVLLAGDERPWFPAEPQLPDWDASDLRLLLAHTPDRYEWARERGFDMVFAGHTHGGQVQLPWIGPIFSPSMHGTRYASGVFDEPSTVMHVSRGVSGLQPLRYRCLPELTQITLAVDSEAKPAACSRTMLVRSNEELAQASLAPAPHPL